MGAAVGSEKVGGFAIGTEKVQGMALGSEKFFDAGGTLVPAAPASMAFSRSIFQGRAIVHATWPPVAGATYYEFEVVGVQARRNVGGRAGSFIFLSAISVGTVFRAWACNAHGCSTSPVSATWNG